MIDHEPSHPFHSLDDPEPTFRDPSREALYRRQGFVILPFLTAAEVGEVLSTYWADIADESDTAMAIDFDRTDRGVMERSRRIIEPLVADRVASLFADHRVVFSTFVVKHPGPGSNMALHEDRSWVDERRHRSGTMWIPLVDVGPDLPNGGLEIVPKSHGLARYWSGSGTPNLMRPYEAWLNQHLIPLTIPAGSAVYYDSRTLHASPPNTSDGPRVAMSLGVVPHDADLLHVVATGTSRRTLYSVDEDFYILFGPWVAKEAMPEGYAVIEEVDESDTIQPGTVTAVIGDACPPPMPVVPVDVAPMPEEPWRPLEPETATATIAGERLEVEPGERRILATHSAPGELSVLAAAPVGTGMVRDDRATNFAAGETYRIDGATSLWNDGPGTLVLTVSACDVMPMTTRT